MPEAHIVIDSREQRPWAFPANVKRSVGTLRTGDYALLGDDNFAIERKSADDFAGTISSGWARFVRELNRMDEAGFVAKIIIVEADFETFCFRTRAGEIIPPDHEHYMLSPQFIKKQIAQLALRGCSVLFAGDAELAAGLALSILWERHETLEKEQRKQEREEQRKV